MAVFSERAMLSRRQETGKEAFELRLWDGRIGRWLTTDPYGQFFSPYLGMGNNPVSTIDPDGGCTKCPKNAKIGDTYQDSEFGLLTYGQQGWADTNGYNILDEVIVSNSLMLNKDGYSDNPLIQVDKIKGLMKGRPNMDANVLAIIMHSTASDNYPGSWMKNEDTVKCAHFFIDKDGTIYQTASLNTSVAHIYNNPKQMYPEYYGTLRNTNTIGIENIANYKNNEWDTPTQEQILANIKLLNLLKHRYHLTDEKILPHETVQRKTEGEGGTMLLYISGQF